MEKRNSLSQPKVLQLVYEKLAQEAEIVKTFEHEYLKWASYWDFGTRTVSFWFDGFIAKVAEQMGIVVALGELGGPEWLQDFDHGLILSRITVGEHSLESREGQWARTPLIPALSWDEVTTSQIHSSLPLQVSSTNSKSALLCTWHQRLFLDDHEVSDFISKSAELGDYSVSFKISGFRGAMFSGNRKLPQTLPQVLTPAIYHPQIVKRLAEQLQTKTGINQPQLI